MDYVYISSGQDMEKFLLALRTTDIVSLDTETDSLDEITANLLLLQIRINDTTFLFDPKYIEKRFMLYIIKLINDTDKLVVGHNLKYDCKVLKSSLGEFPTKLYDTMFAETIINNGLDRQFYSLETLVNKYCNVQLDKSVRETFFNCDKPLTQEQLIYAAGDVRYLLDIRNKQLPKIVETKQEKVFNVEMRLLPVVIDMELTGAKVDIEEWRKLIAEAEVLVEQEKKEILEKIVDKICSMNWKCLLEVCERISIPVTTKRDRELYSTILQHDDIFRKYLYENINITSPKQLKSILSLFGLEVESTNAKIMKDYKKKLPLVEELIIFKEHNKKLTSFGENIIEKIHPKTGRLHSTFHQLATASGRFSSSNPNLQQIPSDNSYRKCFIADDGYVIITVDYSQQELRIAGALSKEPEFIHAYTNNIDIHTKTATIVYKIPIEQVDKEQRRKAKTINFATLYGSSEKGLVYNFGFSPDEAHELLTNFFAGYKVLSKFKEYFEKAIEKNKYSVTMLGRKRFFSIPSILEGGFYEYDKLIKSMKREGFNHAIQGTGADITKEALCKIYYDNPFGTDLKIIMTVHDEIVCMAKEEIAEEACKFICDCMEEVEQKYLGEIPAKVDAHIGKYWSK